MNHPKVILTIITHFRFLKCKVKLESIRKQPGYSTGAQDQHSIFSSKIKEQ